MKRLTVMGLTVILTVMLLGSAAAVEFKGADSLTLKGKLKKPKGDGPFPAVVLLHGCDGVNDERDSMWASRLKSWGYITLQVDSLGPRDDSFICDDNDLMKKYVPKRAMDAHDAKSYLTGLKFVDPKRIAVMGWSHGAVSVIASVSEIPGRDIVPFQAAIAFYPCCDKTLDGLNAPCLILIGDSDEWCPSELCASNMPKEGKTKYEVILKVYPGAHHSFDYPGMDTTYMGRTVRYNHQAESDAKVQVREFLGKHLK